MRHETPPTTAVFISSLAALQKEKVWAIPSIALPCLAVDFCSLLVSALLDSCASRNLISANMFAKLPNRIIGEVNEERIRISTAKEDQHLTSQCDAVIKIKVGGFSWRTRFLVVPGLHAEAILGLEFILKTGLNFDLSEKWANFKFKPEVKIPIVQAFPTKQIVKPNFEEYSLQAETGVDDGPDLSHLSAERADRVRNILAKFPQVLTKKLGRTNLINYDIELSDLKPVRSPPYPLAPPKMEICRGLVQQLLDDDVVEPSISNYASPCFAVPKPNNKHRLVVDYRKLNQKVQFESIPVPDLKTAFSFFGKARYFVVIDLNQAYHQIPLSQKSKPYTAFCTPWNLYQYKCMPFGISVGGCVLSRLLDQVLHDLKFKNLVHYLDDLVLYAETFEELMVLLEEVLERLKRAGLTINPVKLQIAVEKIIYLGHEISYRSIRIDPNRTKPIREFPPPTSTKGIARFIGMVGFYSKFIPQFAHWAAPLNMLRRKNVPFVWTEEHQKAFEHLKDAICNPPILCIPDFKSEFILQSDASNKAVGAVLLQERDGVRMPVSFYSKRLTEAEAKFSTYELECLAAILSMEHFRAFLEHSSFQLETDNMALSWLLSHPRQQGRLARWVLRVSSFRFQVRHIRGTQNIIADSLSRMFEEKLTREEPESAPKKILENIIVPEPMCNVVSPELAHFPLAFQSFQQHQDEDPELKALIIRLQQGELVSGYGLEKGVLCFTPPRSKQSKVVVPSQLKNMIFKFYHESLLGGHLGFRKTLLKIQSSFTYKGMAKEIKELVGACETCAMSKPAQRQQVGHLSSDVASAPMEKVFIDFVGPLVRTARGNRFIFTMVDAFTKFVWLSATPSSTAEVVIKELHKKFVWFGSPKIIVSDNAKVFWSRKLRKWLFNRGIQHVTTTPYYPNPNHSERVNRNLRSALIAYHADSQTKWDSSLDWLTQAFNSATHEAHNSTPHELMFSYKPSSPLALQWRISDLLPNNPTVLDIKENWNRARRNLQLSHERSKKRFDQNRRDHDFRTGDLVFVRTHYLSNKINKQMKKLMPRYDGPYCIMRFVSPVSVLLSDPDNGKIIQRAHVTQLKKFKKADSGN